MLKTIRNDLDEIATSLDHLKANFERLTREERVDLGARVVGIRSTAEALEKELKEEVKAYLKNRDGELRGENFKAILQIIPVTRLDSKLLKADDPVTWMKYARVNDDERVTYRPR